MHKSKNIRIFHQIFQRIREGGDYREDIKTSDHQKNRCAFRKIKKNLGDILTLERQEADIQQQYEQQKEKKQPGGQGLEEILLKSTEKGLGGSVEIPFDAAQHTVVQSSQRRADGENWNAAEYKEKIAYDYISDLI